MPFDYPKELLPHQINELRPEVVGYHAFNPGVASNSPSRSTMSSSHTSQHLVVDGTQIPLVLSATEVEYSKYTTSERVPFDARVVAVLDRYPQGIGRDSLNFNPETLVLIADDSRGYYDVISVPYVKSYHQHFGYRNKISDEMESIRPGSLLRADSVLADTPANIGRFYTQSVNVNTVLLSADVVAEDSVLISEEILESFVYRTFERRSASVGSKKFFVNIGNGDNYKCFYDIGEKVPPDAALMFLRDFTEGLSPALMSRRACREVNYTFDEPVYARQGLEGRVVDVIVTGNSHLSANLPEEMTVQLEKYRKAYIDFNQRLLDAEKKIYVDSTKRFGTKPKLSPDLHRRLVSARGICDENNRKQEKPLQGLLNKNPLDEYRVELVVEYEVTPTNGGKLSSFSGDSK